MPVLFALKQKPAHGLSESLFCSCPHPRGHVLPNRRCVPAVNQPRRAQGSKTLPPPLLLLCRAHRRHSPQSTFSPF